MERISLAKSNHDRQPGDHDADARGKSYYRAYDRLRYTDVRSTVLFDSYHIVFFVLQKQFAEGITGAVK